MGRLRLLFRFLSRSPPKIFPQKKNSSGHPHPPLARHLSALMASLITNTADTDSDAAVANGSNSDSDASAANSDSNSDSDSEKSYEYESSGDDESSSSQIERVSPLNIQISRVQRRYGDTSCWSIGMETQMMSRALRRESDDDACHIYLSFPMNLMFANGKKSLGVVWGFDSEIPMIVRFRANRFLWDKYDLRNGAADFNVVVYQGEEPPSTSMQREQRKKQQATVATAGETKTLAADDSSVDSMLKKSSGGGGSSGGGSSSGGSSKTRFRLATQVQHIVENFLIANWQGHGKRPDDILTMPPPPASSSSSSSSASSSSGSSTKPPSLRRATSSVACPYCTLVCSFTIAFSYVLKLYIYSSYI